MKLPVCPHCGHKINYLQAWALKREGEYWCTECGGFSNIRLKKGIFTIGFGVIILSVAAFLIYLIFTQALNWWILFLMVFPYLLFQIFSPFFVVLKEPQSRQMPQNHHAQPNTSTGYSSVQLPASPRTPQGVPPRQAPPRTVPQNRAAGRPVQPGIYSQRLKDSSPPHIRHL